MTADPLATLAASRLGSLPGAEAVARLAADHLERGGDVALTQGETADLLGVTRGTVAQLVHRGTLPRYGRGVSLRAVLARRAR